MHLFDGAMGTMLQKYGLAGSECPDYCNVSHPDIVQRIHREYAEAGSEYITTNTFGASPLKLADYGLEDQVEAIAQAAVRNARAASPHIRVAGDIGPTGQFIRPLGDLSFDEAASNFYRLAKALADAGADCLIIETIIDIQEMRAALTAAKAACSLPVICQMSYSEDGRTITGTDPAAAAILLDAMGADVIGANCSVGPDKLLEAAKQMARVTDKPLIIQPNAGMPVLDGNTTRFPLAPEDMAPYIARFAEAGVTFAGGCCGTTPAHIRAMREAMDRLPAPEPRPAVEPLTAFTSRTRTVFVGPGHAPVMIGERINPTGRKKMREEIQSGSFVSVKKEALAQVAAGADMLDVNMGVPGIDQSAAMEKVVMELSMLCPAPLSIDSTDPAVLEKAVKIYPGRPLINSVSADPALMEKVFPLARKYGAAVLCLPLAKGGLPKTAEERIALIRQILETARSFGLRRQDLLLDPLVLTAASDQKAPSETLRTLRLYREQFHCPTVMGTSNVSFGLPGRPQLNAAFLSMAFACGMDAPIINPLDETMQRTFAEARLLLGFDAGARQYIASVSETPAAVPSSSVSSDKPVLEQIRDAIRNGEKEEAARLMNDAIQEKMSPDRIIKEGLTAAMTEVGDAYGIGKVYLPQVMMAAEAMQSAFSELKVLLPSMKNDSKGTALLCTVQGDIHDLGKNIVAALLENSGYRVIDLGKDVAPEAILAEAKRTHVDFFGLCSLMTTTLPELKKTAALLREHIPACRIMVGGAVVTPEYAREIGADAYAKDGVDAVRKADQLMTADPVSE